MGWRACSMPLHKPTTSCKPLETYHCMPSRRICDKVERTNFSAGCSMRHSMPNTKRCWSKRTHKAFWFMVLLV